MEYRWEQRVTRADMHQSDYPVKFLTSIIFQRSYPKNPTYILDLHLIHHLFWYRCSECSVAEFAALFQKIQLGPLLLALFNCSLFIYNQLTSESEPLNSRTKREIPFGARFTIRSGLGGKIEPSVGVTKIKMCRFWNSENIANTNSYEKEERQERWVDTCFTMSYSSVWFYVRHHYHRHFTVLSAMKISCVYSRIVWRILWRIFFL